MQPLPRHEAKITAKRRRHKWQDEDDWELDENSNTTTSQGEGQLPGPKSDEKRVWACRETLSRKQLLVADAVHCLEHAFEVWTATTGVVLKNTENVSCCPRNIDACARECIVVELSYVGILISRDLPVWIGGPFLGWKLSQVTVFERILLVPIAVRHDSFQCRLADIPTHVTAQIKTLGSRQ